MKEMANCIRSMRLSRRMTQTELAEVLGVQYQTVSKWETGATVPDVAMLPRIADFFGVSMDALFGRKRISCTGDIPEDRLIFLLKTYSQMYGPEAGPWNLSVENKYLMYRFQISLKRILRWEKQTAFATSESVPVNGMNICPTN